jgi:PEGA domain
VASIKVDPLRLLALFSALNYFYTIEFSVWRVEMFTGKAFSLLLAVSSIGMVGLLDAQNRVLAELRFMAHNRAEKTAGVWVDGQYVGYVKELNGDKKMLLLPGKHEIVVRQPWYRDYVEQAVLEPGEVHTVTLTMTKKTHTLAQDATGELKISAIPTRAAVFVDEQFAGHVDEFDGLGKAMLLTPGQHRVRIALPGYLPLETVVDLRPHQKLKIQTELVKGSITEAGVLVSQK